ncbi:MAG: beta-ketoacyl-ACP synthase II [Anaerolineae bacterium]
MERTDDERVVITGSGAISPLGHTVSETWENLVAGKSGIGRITLFDATDFPTRFAGEVKDFDPTKYITRKEARRMGRSSQFSVAIACQALEDAGLSYPFDDGLAERTGVVLGTAIGGFDSAERGLFALWSGGLSKVTPFALPAAMPNMVTFHNCLRFNAQGYTNTTVTACAAGTHALGEALNVIRRGRCDVMLAGGVEAMIIQTTFAGFAAMRALSTRNGDPTKASRPFDAERDGFVIGEGGAIFVLERLSHAKARGARIQAELLGEANSSDTYHIAAPDPEGRGAVRTMRWALEDAGIGPDDVDYINAHGTGTPLGDPAETQAIKSLFGERAYEIPISATKSMIGHSFGGAGALEALACVKALETGVIHPTINYQTPDPTCDLDYVPNKARKHQVRVALSNSFGLGGQNACLVLRRYENGEEIAQDRDTAE